jgi:hypothetical protein
VRLGAVYEQRGSLSHLHTLKEVLLANFSIVEYARRKIKKEIEAFTGEPARLVRLVLFGPPDWMSARDRRVIEAAQCEIEREKKCGSFAERQKRNCTAHAET